MKKSKNHSVQLLVFGIVTALMSAAITHEIMALKKDEHAALHMYQIRREEKRKMCAISRPLLGIDVEDQLELRTSFDAHVYSLVQSALKHLEKESQK